MTIFLILLPFGVFSLLMLLVSADMALFAAAATGLAVIAHDFLRGRQLKTLGAGSVVLFIGLGLYIALVDSSLGASAIKLAVDAGVLAISLTSIAIRKPFTLQYARELVDAETLALPGFLKANYAIAWAWCACFLLMMAGNMLMIYVPGLPLWAGLAIAFAARSTAVYFTRWYPDYRRTKYATPAVSGALSGS
ncbi:MAG: hypothetical protein Q7J60_05020 [Bradyrhizobium sp.]|uniref:hypothetical protein n=1 Tax=Bradyrhizobium sp. TaxID=376 RepID=UPI002719B5DD|nr:hypothetical protein [Bradyrhizobium sp.]MDO9560961.1 hypothetical protein [Bradyrhizobium sp.]MDP3694270.1 hypothetical protein [Bradyrhizobium sp.]